MDTTPVTTLRSRLDKALGLRSGIQARLDGTVAEVKRLENEQSLLDLVGSLLRKLIDQEVTVGVQAVEQLQTEGLQAVFSDQDIRVKTNVEVLRGKVSVDLITVHKHPNGIEVEGGSTDSFGGSVATVQSVLLRMIIIMRRNLRRVLLLDEALPAFDQNYIHNMCRFLSVLCQRLGFDILLVTHDPAVVDTGDKAYRHRHYRLVVKNDAAQFALVKHD